MLGRQFARRVAKCYLELVSQPVKVSDELLLEARMVSELSHRSIAKQIEYWAQLGKALEPLLRGDQALALRRSGAERPLSECLESVDTPAGRRRVMEQLGRLPFPHYEPASTPGLLIRIEADGSRTLGRFVNREFQPSE